MRNYHSHTARCGHAWGTDEEFVQAAIDAGYTTLGISEHSPWPFVDGYQELDSRQRITMEQLDGYLTDMQALKEKYKDKIEIKVGLECEYFPRYFDWLKTVKPKLDYLLLGVHCSEHDEHLTHYYARYNTPQQMEEYLRCALAGMETGLFSYLAHPELCLADYPVYDEVCKEISTAFAKRQKSWTCLWNIISTASTSREEAGKRVWGIPVRFFGKRRRNMAARRSLAWMPIARSISSGSDIWTPERICSLWV